MILYGPPGTGKTTVARLIASVTGAAFEELSAVNAGKADVQAVVARARDRLGANGQRTILFLDEIHRFNKAQQDALLPVVESGLVTLVGATTENPYHDVIGALLSRCRLHEFRPLDSGALERVLERAATSLGPPLPDEAARDALLTAAGGDARSLLVALEVARDHALSRRAPDLEATDVAEAVERTARQLRQVRRSPLRHGLGLHQERPRLRSRRRALLPRLDDRGRRGPDVHLPAADHPRERGHRQRRSRTRCRSPSPASRRCT